MLFLYLKSPEKLSPYHGELAEHLVRSVHAREKPPVQDTQAELRSLIPEAEGAQFEATREAESEVAHDILDSIKRGETDLEAVMPLLEEADRMALIDLLSQRHEYDELHLQFMDFLETNPEYNQDIAQEGETFKGKFAEIMEGLEKLPGAIWESIKEAGRVTLDFIKGLPLPVKLALGCVLIGVTVSGGLALLQAWDLTTLEPAFEAWRGALDLPDLAILTPEVIGEATNMLSSAPPL